MARVLSPKRLEYLELRKTKEFKTFEKKLLKTQSELCNYCGKPVFEDITWAGVVGLDENDNEVTAPRTERYYNYHIDHVVPLVAGGTNDFSNLVIACVGCNVKKGRKLEWSLV